MILRIDMASQVPIYVQRATRLSGALPGGVRRGGEPAHRPPTGGGPGGEYHDGEQSLPSPEGGRLFETDRRHGATVCRAGDPNGSFGKKLAEELELLIAEAKLKGGAPGGVLLPMHRRLRGNGGVTMLLFIIFFVL